MYVLFILFCSKGFVCVFKVLILYDFGILVAKRKSLFDDKAVEIEELTYIIKQVS